MAKRAQCQECAFRQIVVNLEQEESGERCSKRSPLFSSNSDEYCDYFEYKPQPVMAYCGFCQKNTNQVVVGKQTLTESANGLRRGETYQVLKCDVCKAANFGERLA